MSRVLAGRTSHQAELGPGSPCPLACKRTKPGSDVDLVASEQAHFRPKCRIGSTARRVVAQPTSAAIGSMGVEQTCSSQAGASTMIACVIIQIAWALARRHRCGGRLWRPDGWLVTAWAFLVRRNLRWLPIRACVLHYARRDRRWFRLRQDRCRGYARRHDIAPSRRVVQARGAAACIRRREDVGLVGALLTQWPCF